MTARFSGGGDPLSTLDYADARVNPVVWLTVCFVVQLSKDQNRDVRRALPLFQVLLVHMQLQYVESPAATPDSLLFPAPMSREFSCALRNFHVISDA